MRVEHLEHFFRVEKRMMLEQMISFPLSFMLFSNLVFLNSHQPLSSFLVSDIPTSCCLKEDIA